MDSETLSAGGGGHRTAGGPSTFLSGLKIGNYKERQKRIVNTRMPREGSSDPG